MWFRKSETDRLRDEVRHLQELNVKALQKATDAMRLAEFANRCLEAHGIKHVPQDRPSCPCGKCTQDS